MVVPKTLRVEVLVPDLYKLTLAEKVPVFLSYTNSYTFSFLVTSKSVNVKLISEGKG
jgi:hypothetical protein